MATVDLGQQTYAVVLAGGEGTRFAPLSTPERPKQFLRVFGERTLFQQTLDRLQTCLPPDRYWVATNTRYEEFIRTQAPSVRSENIILETAKRNTAPAIALAAHLLHARDPEAVMIVLPADHVILDRGAFVEVLHDAVALATSEHALITLGIHPTRPATEYGYIRRAAMLGDTPRPVYRVGQFVEKPDAATAQRYLDAGDYYWNSGMFVWEAATILAEIRAHLPRMAAALGRPDFFSIAESISIDYGVMERSTCAVTVPCEIGWSDIGTWESLKCLVERHELDVTSEVRHYLDTFA